MLLEKKSSRHINFLTLFFISMMMTACFSKPWLVKPDKSYLNNIKIQSIEIIKSDAVSSNTIVAALKSKLIEDAADLKGTKAVKMIVTLDYLTTPLPGGSITASLMGSSTSLRGTVKIIDGSKVIAKYNVSASYSEGGLLGKTTTISFIDTQNMVISKFSAYAISYMQ